MKKLPHFIVRRYAVASVVLLIFNSFILQAFPRRIHETRPHAVDSGTRQSDNHVLQSNESQSPLAELGSIFFIPNAGQEDPWIKYTVWGGPVPAALTSDGMEFLLAKDQPVGEGRNSSDPRRGPIELGRGHRPLRSSIQVFMQLAGANRDAKVEATEELATKFGVLSLGKELPTYRKVIYNNIYDGINVIFHGESGDLEYDFVIAPHISVDKIDIRYTPTAEVVVDDNGDLAIRWNGVELKHHKPVAYQIINGEKLKIDAKYVMLGPNKIAIRVGEYDHNKELIVDPVLGLTNYITNVITPNSYLV